MGQYKNNMRKLNQKLRNNQNNLNKINAKPEKTSNVKQIKQSKKKNVRTIFFQSNLLKSSQLVLLTPINLKWSELYWTNFLLSELSPF